MFDSNAKWLKERLDGLTEFGDPLVRLNELIDWQLFMPAINRAFYKMRKSPAGRKHYCRLMMFKVLILQTLYNISDHQMEYQIRDRLSFMRFLGLRLRDPAPDEKTIWNYREVLSQGGYIDKLFEAFENHLASKGMGAKIGTIIDASIVSAPKQRNSKEDNDKIKAGEIPESMKENLNQFRQKDMDGRWTQKNRQNYYGYKNHIGIDANYKFIRAYEVTPANMADINCFDSLLPANYPPNWYVWADAAYRSEEQEKKLSERGFKSRIITRGYRSLPPGSSIRRENTRRSKIRARVEHVFGFMTNTLKENIVRTIGLRRAKTKIGLVNIVYNVCRYEQIHRLGVA